MLAQYLEANPKRGEARSQDDQRTIRSPHTVEEGLG